MMASTDRATSFLRPPPSRVWSLSNHDYRCLRAAPGGRLHRDAQGRRNLCFACASSGRLSRAGKQAPRTARLSAFGRRHLDLSGRPIATEALQIDIRCGDIAAAHFQSLAWRRALPKALTAPGPRSLRYQAPSPRQCTEATIALPHQTHAAPKPSLSREDNLALRADYVWSRIMIAFSCPASEHVSWHNSC